MSLDNARVVGNRVAYQRRMARLTQEQLAAAAGIHVGTLRKIERGARGAGDGVLEALASALGIDVLRLHGDADKATRRVHHELAAISDALATYDCPDDGPVRPVPELRKASAHTVEWRLSAQYLRIARQAPVLLAELFRGMHTARGAHLAVSTHLLVDVCRSADAVAYKHGAANLSARLIEIMRWATPHAEDPLLAATVAYVRAETFFMSRAYAAGLGVLESAIDSLPVATGPSAHAARGALHMRAAVMAGRAGRADVATEHMASAHRMADGVPEGIYRGTAFGPDSVRVHDVSLCVSLGGHHLLRALDISRHWEPPETLPAERRSGFFIELARAQLWAGKPDAAFASLLTARRIAPQHTREHRWVREDAGTLRRLKRSSAESLSGFAEWCHATG
ncbi:helix-turn-helix domain-containing protein [Streptomyces carpaticus]|uniref:Helix-turn-helix domain-containing protein n=1 Tax=Streptomyces carpaticus TaxID=285558 RepID=A0ABV4ZJS1_9ACTN